MKPLKKWNGFDWAWSILGALTIGFQVGNLVQVIINDEPHEVLTTILALFIIAIWIWLLHLQLVVTYRNDLRHKKLMAEMDERHKKIMESFKK